MLKLLVQYIIHVFCQRDVGSERRPYNNDQDDDFRPPTKMRHIGFKKHATSTSQLDRFADKTSTDKVQEYSKGTICKNTTACNSWVMQTFEAWRSNRNKDAPQEEQVPTDRHSLNERFTTRCSQTTDRLSKVCYIYVEHGSKNHSGGLSDLQNPNKKGTR